MTEKLTDKREHLRQQIARAAWKSTNPEYFEQSEHSDLDWRLNEPTFLTMADAVLAVPDIAAALSRTGTDMGEPHTGEGQKPVAWRYRFEPGLCWHVVGFENEIPRRANYPQLEVRPLIDAPTPSEDTQIGGGEAVRVASSSEEIGGFLATIAALANRISEFEATLIYQPESTSVPEGMGWQPIETAPKDGTEFDAWPGNSEFPRRIVDVSWREPTDSEWWVHGGDTIKTTDATWHDAHGPLTKDEVPTHWMPQPSPPDAPSQSQSQE